MIIRLGYVSISKTVEKYVNFKSITYTNYEKIKDFNKLDNIIKHNLNSLKEILIYNMKNNINFYRISSNLIPLATKKEVDFNYLDTYDDYYQQIKEILQKTNMRVDMHPSNYCVLNSTRKEVVDASIEIIKYHYNILEKLGIQDKLIILHIGSSVLGKKNSLARFINNFNKLPKHLREIIAIENDDKVFNIEDCLYISDNLNIPVVLDYHHFKYNKTDKELDFYLPKIMKSWKSGKVKMHFSSPKSKKEFRSHNDYINVDEFIKFLNILSKYDKDIDIMLEAKAKDEALFKLIREIKFKTNYKFLNDTNFEVS